VPLLGDIPYIGSLFKYQSRNHKRTNLMIFLRPVVLKDGRGAAALTADRYEYIRNLQGEIRELWNGPLPEQKANVLTPLETARDKPLGQTETR
jgi:general secretion pathway protein D